LAADRLRMAVIHVERRGMLWSMLFASGFGGLGLKTIGDGFTGLGLKAQEEEKMTRGSTREFVSRRSY
jgi:hypothetical protein